MLSFNAHEKRRQKLTRQLRVKGCRERRPVSFLAKSLKCPCARQQPILARGQRCQTCLSQNISGSSVARGQNYQKGRGQESDFPFSLLPKRAPLPGNHTEDMTKNAGTLTHGNVFEQLALQPVKPYKPQGSDRQWQPRDPSPL